MAAQPLLIEAVSKFTSADLIDITNACGPVTPTATTGQTGNSLVKTKDPELFPINLTSERLGKRRWLAEYAKRRERAPILTAKLSNVDCEGGTEHRMRLHIVDGSIQGSAVNTCSNITLDSCATGTSPTLIGNQTTLDVSVIDMYPKLHIYNFSQCLNPLLQQTPSVLDTNLFSRTYNMDFARNVAETLTRNVVDIMEYTVAKADFLENSDKGLLATVMAVSGNTISLDDTSMLEVFADDLLAFYTPSGTYDACLPICGAETQTYNFKGYLRVDKSTINRALHTAEFKRTYDIPPSGTAAALLPAVTIAAGMKIFATTGEYLSSTNAGTNGTSPTTGYFGGTAYRVPKPYPGIDIDNSQHVSGTYTEMLNCCLYNSGFNGALEIAALDDLPQIIGGDFWRRFKPLLKPHVICCGMSGEDQTYYQLTDTDLMGYIDHARYIMEQARDYQFLPQFDTNKIYVRARYFTMQAIRRTLLANYNYAEKQMTPNADGKFTLALDPRDRIEVLPLGNGMEVIFDVVEYGMKEGDIYIGPDNIDATIVYSDLQGLFQSDWNMGRMAREVPLSYVGTGQGFIPSDYERYRNEVITVKPAGAGRPPVMTLNMLMSRYYQRVPMFGGAVTIIKNAFYRLPFACDPTCSTISCGSCTY